MKIFEPKVKAKGNEEILLPVKHFIQNNNSGGQGYRECCGTSNAMLTEYLVRFKNGAKHREPEDEYFQVLAKYGDTTDHTANTRTLEEFGIESYWSNTLSISNVAYMIRQGFPVVIGTHYKGSGHIVIAPGVNSGGLDILCPYGIRRGSSDSWIEIFYQNSQAKKDVFTWSLCKKVFEKYPNDGWGRVVTSVNGVKTALHPDILGKRM